MLGVERVVPPLVTGLDMEVNGIIQKVEGFVRLLRGRRDWRGCVLESKRERLPVIFKNGRQPFYAGTYLAG